MRNRIIQTLAVLLITLSVSAQYKKASFLSKEGSTYEFGTKMYAMGDGKGSPIGFFIGFGHEPSAKQTFSGWDLQYIPSFQYTYSSVDGVGDPMVVTGKSKATLIFAMNFDFHLLKNEDGKKVKPYILTGFNLPLSSGPKVYDDYQTQYPKRNPSEQTIGAGLSGGLGCLFNLNPTLGLKLQGGYSKQFNYSVTNGDDDEKPFFMFTSHPFASLGLRIRIERE